MRTWLKVAFWITMIPATFVLVMFLLAVFLTHGHGMDPLDVTVRVVMQDTGEPVTGATVAVLRARAILDDDEFFRSRLEDALRSRETSDASSWRGGFVWAEITDTNGTATIPAGLGFAIWDLADIQVARTENLPQSILIEHPALGRTIVPIDPDSPFEEGEEPDTWKLDLGTITLPR